MKNLVQTLKVMLRSKGSINNLSDENRRHWIFQGMCVCVCMLGVCVYVCVCVCVYYAGFSLSISNVVVGPDSVAPIMIVWWPSVKSMRKLKKKTKIEIYYWQDLEITQHTGGHTTRSRVERKKGHGGLEFCFHWSWGWWSRVLCIHSLLMNLKQQNMLYRKRTKNK